MPSSVVGRYCRILALDRILKPNLLGSGSPANSKTLQFTITAAKTERLGAGAYTGSIKRPVR